MNLMTPEISLNELPDTNENIQNHNNDPEIQNYNSAGNSKEFVTYAKTVWDGKPMTVIFDDNQDSTYHYPTDEY